MIATRPDWCISRQRVWGVPIIVFYCDSCQEPLTDRKILDRVVELVRRAYRRCLVRALRRRTGRARMPVARSAARPSCAKKPTFWTSGSIPDRAIWPCSREANGLPWPADLYLEGGDQYRGWFHSSLLVGVALRGRAPYRAAPPRLDARRAGPRAVEIARQLIEPEEIIKKYGADVLRLWAASVDFTEDVRVLRHHPGAAVGGLSQAAQHVPLRARQPVRFRSGARRGSGGRVAGDRPVDSLARRAAGPRLPRAGTTNSRSTRSIAPFTTSPRRSQLDLFRRAEGSSLHRRARVRKPAAARRPRSTGWATRSSACWLRSSASPPTRSGVICRSPPARPKRPSGAVPGARGTDGRHLRRAREARAANWDRLMEVRDSRSQEPRDRAGGEVDRRAARGPRAPARQRRSLSAAGASTRRNFPALFIVSQVALEKRRLADLSRSRSTRRGDKVRALLEIHHRFGSHPEFPTICAAAPTLISGAEE